MKKVEFSTREPIGSSTYPMPSDVVDHECYRKMLSGSPLQQDKTATLYIHIPFCDQLCSFCGFNKFVSTNDRKEEYIKALLIEMELYSNYEYTSSLDIQAVYIGGGTPNSLSPDQLDTILTAMHKFLPLSKNCEITCEGTPQNFTSDRISVLKKHNVSRVSAGIQTLDKKIRDVHLNMKNGEEELTKFVHNIANNFNSFNLDFIYNLPYQTMDIWNKDLDFAFSSGSTHLTIYPLVLLERTAFYSDYVLKNKYEPPRQDMELEFFYQTQERISKTGYKSYTVRDWAKEGKECKYIKLNAECNQVLALGAGAHGYVGGITYRNIKNLDTYAELLLSKKTFPLDGYRMASDQEKMERFMVMGLRKYSLNMEEFNTKFNTKWQEVFGEKLYNLEYSEYLQIKDNIVTYTPLGHVWANNIRTYFESEKGKSVGYSDSLGVGETGKDHYSKISRVKASADVEAVK